MPRLGDVTMLQGYLTQMLYDTLDWKRYTMDVIHKTERANAYHPRASRYQAL